MRISEKKYDYIYYMYLAITKNTILYFGIT